MMKCANDQCNKPIPNKMQQYGEIDNPICWDCHMDSLKYCEFCDEWTVHTSTNSHYQSGYCLTCYAIMLQVHGHVVEDTQAIEDDLRLKYMQAKLFDFSIGVNHE